MSKKAVVIHSGGMDSSICLKVAIKEFGSDQVESLTFSYAQRHNKEIEQAKKIAAAWGVSNSLIHIDCLQEITRNALVTKEMPIVHEAKKSPSTLVVGCNGLMARLGAIYAHQLNACCIYMGIVEVEGSNAGYRDCSRKYMDLEQEVLRIDLDNPLFEIRTPLVRMSKKESLELANELGVLDFLLRETVTCYEGIQQQGCKHCPACKLRNEGIREFTAENPTFAMPYSLPSF